MRREQTFSLINVQTYRQSHTQMMSNSKLKHIQTDRKKETVFKRHWHAQTDVALVFLCVTSAGYNPGRAGRLLHPGNRCEGTTTLIS